MADNNYGLGRIDEHLEEEHYAPERTVPQGTQENGVEHGHETRDIKLRLLGGWFMGLTIGTFLLIGVTWGLYRGMQYVLARLEPERPPFALVQPAPPLPRLLPNPQDSPLRPHETLTGPVEFRMQEQKQEEERLAGYGLLDPATGRNLLPEAALRSVTRGQEGTGRTDGDWLPGTGYGNWLPSDSSGGTRPENSLR